MKQNQPPKATEQDLFFDLATGVFTYRQEILDGESGGARVKVPARLMALAGLSMRLNHVIWLPTVALLAVIPASPMAKRR